MPKSVRISAIIPTRGGFPVLCQSLPMLRNSLTADDEIIVVVNGPDNENQITLGFVHSLEKPDSEGPPVRVIKLDYATSCGYSAAVNAGLQAANGKFLALLHDDILVPENWAAQLLEVREHLTQLLPDLRWGFVGPYTNTGPDTQNITVSMKSAGDPTNIHKVNEYLASLKTMPKFVAVGELQGCCLLMTREAYEATGLFDEETFGLAGYEMTDYLWRARLQGYSAAVATKLFVYHRGRYTLNKIAPHLDGGLANRLVFTRKWSKPTSKTLCAAYTLRLDEYSMLWMLADSLNVMKNLADQIIIVDQQSKLDIRQELNRIHSGVAECIQHYVKIPKESSRDLLRCRNVAIECARKTGADWTWMLSLGEIPDSKLTKESLQELMNPLDPTVQAYQFAVYTFWRGKTHVRVDAPWGERTQESLFRNLPHQGCLYDITGTPPGRSPSIIPADKKRFTGRIAIKDYEYSDYGMFTQRVQMGATDEEGTKEDQMQMLDERPAVVAPYYHPTATYLLMARNEADDVLRHAIEHSTWLDKFLVLDCSSIDDSADIYKQCGIPYTTYACCEEAEDPAHFTCDLGAARNAAIQQCDTDYIIFMDPDEALDNTAFPLVPRLLLENRDGYICEIRNYKQSAKGSQYIQKTFQPRLFRNDERIFYAPEIHETLQPALTKHPELEIIDASGLIVHHYGFIRYPVGTAKRAWRHDVYSQQLEKLLEREPADPRALFALGEHRMFEGDANEGFRLLCASLKADPNFFQARFELAVGYIRHAFKVLKETPKASIPRDDMRKSTEMLLRDLGKWVSDEE